MKIASLQSKTQFSSPQTLQVYHAKNLSIIAPTVRCDFGSTAYDKAYCFEEFDPVQYVSLRLAFQHLLRIWAGYYQIQSKN